MRNVIANFLESMIEIAGCYNKNSNDKPTTWQNGGEWKDMAKFTAKEIQVALKVSQRKTELLDFEHRLGFDKYGNVSWIATSRLSGVWTNDMSTISKCSTNWATKLSNLGILIAK